MIHEMPGFRDCGMSAFVHIDGQFIKEGNHSEPTSKILCFCLAVNGYKWRNGMNWYQNLYVGKTAYKKKDEMIAKLEQKQDLLRAYLITLAPDEQNQLEIVAPTIYWRQAERNKYEPMIVGLAWGMREAREVLVEMTDEVYRSLGKLDYRSYFQHFSDDPTCSK